MHTTLLITHVRLPDGTPVDIAVDGGRIEEIGPNLQRSADVVRAHGQGALVLPGFVEGHTHLDKTNWGLPWYRNEVGPRLIDRIENERSWRASTGHDAGAQSLALARAFLAAGTTRLRTHVDIDTDAGLEREARVILSNATDRGGRRIPED